MASNPRAKRTLPLDDDGDWDEDRDNEEDGEEEGDAYDWSKPMLMEEERNYGRVRGKQPQKDDSVLHENDVAAKLALEIEKKGAQNYEK